MTPAHRLIAARDGQSTVEMIALLPALLTLGLLLACGLAAGRAHELAAHAAGAGAMAVIQGGDAERAAREALPAVRRRDVEVSVRGDRVRVRITPRLPVPGLGVRLRASSVATAGEAP